MKSTPNFIIFMPDQLRTDSLACFGNDVVQTPHIDAFAAEGVKFTDAYVQASVCSQSRSSMFTGWYPHVAGHRTLENLIKPWEPNLFRYLKESGYHVAWLGPRGDTFAPDVTELSVHEYGFIDPPDVLPNFSDGRSAVKDESPMGRLFYKGERSAQRSFDYDEAVIRSAEKWLETGPPEPYCLFMPLLFPHCPFQVEEPFYSLHKRATIPLPLQVKDMSGYQPRYLRELREQYGTDKVTPDQWRELKATYYGMVSRIDAQFGRIIAKVKSIPGLWDRSVMFFFTDHGEYLGDYGMIEKWPSGLHNCLVREPLIVGGGGIKPKDSDAIVEMVDLMPTILDMASIPVKHSHNGKSLLPILFGNAKEHKKYAYSEGGFLKEEEPLLEQAPYPYDIKAGLQHSDTTLVGKAISCRNKHFTYIMRLYEPCELYDRKDTDKERFNLSGISEYANVEAEMREAVLHFLFETSDVIPWEKDPRFPVVNLLSPKKQIEIRLGQWKAKRNAVMVTNGTEAICY